MDESYAVLNSPAAPGAAPLRALLFLFYMLPGGTFRGGDSNSCAGDRHQRRSNMAGILPRHHDRLFGDERLWFARRGSLRPLPLRGNGGGHRGRAPRQGAPARCGHRNPYSARRLFRRAKTVRRAAFGARLNGRSPRFASTHHLPLPTLVAGPLSCYDGSISKPAERGRCPCGWKHGSTRSTTA